MKIAPWNVPSNALDICEDKSVHAEASTLGFPPGQYPGELQVEPSVGNGQVFDFERFDGNQTAHYVQRGHLGLRLLVWND
jgi:hypothetical protein